MHFQHRKSPKEHVKEHVFFLGGGVKLGGGGGLPQKFMTGLCGPNLEDTPYSYKGQARKPYLFIYFDIKTYPFGI